MRFSQPDTEQSGYFRYYFYETCQTTIETTCITKCKIVVGVRWRVLHAPFRFGGWFFGILSGTMRSFEAGFVLLLISVGTLMCVCFIHLCSLRDICGNRITSQRGTPSCSCCRHGGHHGVDHGVSVSRRYVRVSGRGKFINKRTFYTLGNLVPSHPGSRAQGGRLGIPWNVGPHVQERR